MTETKPQHRLIIYDQNGNIIWDGLLTSAFPILEPGSVFWTGGFAPPQKRDWYTVEKSMTGVETQTGQVVTELVVSHSKEEHADSRSSCERSDQPSRAVKRREKGELQVIEEAREVALKCDQNRWKMTWWNKAKTIRVDFLWKGGDGWVVADCFIESRQGPIYKCEAFREIGSRCDLQLDDGKLTILTTARGTAANPEDYRFRIIEFSRGV